MSSDHTYQLFLLESLSVFLTEKDDRLKPAVSLHSPEMHWHENGEIAAWDVTSACRRVFVSLHALQKLILKLRFTPIILSALLFDNLFTYWPRIITTRANEDEGFSVAVRDFGKAITQRGSWIARAFRNHLLRHGFMHRSLNDYGNWWLKKWLEMC